jgi:glutamate racemase
MRWLWVHYLGFGMALYRLCWVVVVIVACNVRTSAILQLLTKTFYIKFVGVFIIQFQYQIPPV